MKNFIKRNMAKMRNKNYLLILTILFLFVQCESDEQKRFELAEKNMKEKWDRESYIELKKAEFDCFPYCEGSFKYTYIMANLFNDGRACSDITSEIVSWYRQNNLELDSVAISQIIYYLEKGANIGDASCKTALYLLFSRGDIPGFKGIVEVDTARANKYK